MHAGEVVVQEAGAGVTPVAAQFLPFAGVGRVRPSALTHSIIKGAFAG